VTTGCLSLAYHVVQAWELCTQVQAGPNMVLGLCDSNLEGDFSFTFSVAAGGPRRFDADGAAVDPAGSVSLGEALEQQLGLKLERARRAMPVFIIDHVEENPTEN